MKFKASGLKRRATIDGLEITFTVPRYQSEAVDSFLNDFDGEMNVDITKPRKRRSSNANAYLWALLGEIAKAINASDREVYRELIRDVGVYHRAVVENKDKDAMISLWEQNGVGYVAQVESADSKVTVLRLYAGSHTYDSKQFGRLLDEAVDEARSLGIPVKATRELEAMMEAYK